MTQRAHHPSQPEATTPAGGFGRVVAGRPPSTVAILVPVLNRPHNVKPLLRSLHEFTQVPYRVLFILSPDDPAELEAVEDSGQDFIVPPQELNYAGKINVGARHAMSIGKEPYLFLGADDLRFHAGWFEYAKDQLIATGALVCGTNDLCNPKVIAGMHATHFLVDSRYFGQGTIDETDKLLHEGYEHEFVDNEFIETAQHRDVYTHCHDSVVEHMHPMAGKAPMDKLYEEMPRRMKQGQAVFKSRRHLWA